MGDAEDLDLRLGAYDGDLDHLLDGVRAACLDGALLELDGSAIELHDFIESRSEGDRDLLERNRRARKSHRHFGPILFGGRKLALPIEGDNVEQLRSLAANFADPEIAICLSVRARDGTLLLEAPDIGDDEIWVNSKRVSAEQADALRRALRTGLR
jgi:hypothetical protein